MGQCWALRRDVWFGQQREHERRRGSLRLQRPLRRRHLLFARRYTSPDPATRDTMTADQLGMLLLDVILPARCHSTSTAELVAAAAAAATAAVTPTTTLAGEDGDQEAAAEPVVAAWVHDTVVPAALLLHV